MRHFWLPLLAVIGIGCAVYMIYLGVKPAPVAPVIFRLAQSPYKNYVAGVGIIESVYKNIPIGIPFTDVVAQVFVRVGDRVKKGSPLFKLDTRTYEAQLVQASRVLQYAQIDYENKKTQFSFYQRLTDQSAVSEQAYANAMYALQLAQQEVETAKATVDVIKTNIERSYALAPLDGQVLQLNVRVGKLAKFPQQC